jgi:aromatic-L-amino-acid decarboxylase
MHWDEFAHWGKHITDWASEYHKTLGDRPVRAQTNPGDISVQLPAAPPEGGEAMDHIMADFERVVMPGITHWQHPRFFAYFTSNAAPPSMHVVADLACRHRNGRRHGGLAASGLGPARPLYRRDPG